MALNQGKPMTKLHKETRFGLIIPCFNEEEVIPLLLEELCDFERECPARLCVLFIDDGSHDRTATLLSAACRENPNYELIRFARNFGHQAAVSAGIDHIDADVVGIIDADLQDPPRVLLGMLQKWDTGYEVVYGVRKNRKENILLRFSYSLFYRILKRMANIDIPLDAGDFCIMDRQVVNEIRKMNEHHRFIRGLRGWVGFSQFGFEYERQARQAGLPKYDFSKLLKLAFDGLVTFSSVPLRISAWVGALASIFGLIYVFYAVTVFFIKETVPSGWTSLVVIVIFFGGIQLIVLGILGEYIARIFDEVKNRPHYIIREHLKKTKGNTLFS